MSDKLLAVFMFLAYTLLVFSHGFSRGYEKAIDDMKKIRSRK